MAQSRKSSKEATRHPIGVVEQRTGIPQDVIRVWERRYGAVRPSRGPGGQRVYDDADIERLRLLHAATRAGRRIGGIASLPTGELARLVAEDTAAIEARQRSAVELPDIPSLVDEALALTRSLDARGLDAMLRRAAARLGMSAFMESVAAPVLRIVGDAWHAGRLGVAHEHVASSVLHDIIMDAMRSLSADGMRPSVDARRVRAGREGAERIVVATPAGERHAIGAALVGATAAVEGWNVIYLGADLPAAEIADAARADGVSLVAVSVVYVEDRARVLEEMRALRASMPAEVPLLAGGAGAALLRAELTEIGVEVAESLADLRAVMRR